MLRFEDSFDRLMSELLSLKSCEVTEEEKNYVLEFDLPGVSKGHDGSPSSVYFTERNAQ